MAEPTEAQVQQAANAVLPLADLAATFYPPADFVVLALQYGPKVYGLLDSLIRNLFPTGAEAATPAQLQVVIATLTAQLVADRAELNKVTGKTA